MSEPIESWEAVRDELLSIIDAHPNETGHVGPVTCEYFVDAQLRQPSCIVGYWLSRHPDLLDEVEGRVRGNDEALTLFDETDLPTSVVRLLCHAQGVQDGPPMPWGGELRRSLVAWEPDE